MGSYGVVKEALLVKKNGPSDEYSVVQKLVPATVNGMAISYRDGGFNFDGTAASIYGIYHGGAFCFSDSPGDDISVTVNIPGYGVKMFNGEARVQNVNGVGKCVMCTPKGPGPTALYTHLCLVVESPGSVFAEN